MNENNILLTVKKDGCLMVMQTIDRKHGKSRRFMMLRTELVKWLDSAEFEKYVPRYDCDLESFASLHKDVPRFEETGERNVCVKLNWMSVDNVGNIRGYQQIIHVPENILRNGGKYLCKPHTPTTSPIVWSESAKAVLRRIGYNPFIRRAFCKGIARNFKWEGTKFTMYADGKYDFFFRTNDGICGGFICHEYGDGRYTYSVHT